MADYQSPITATLTGIINAFKKQKKIGDLKETDRVDGKTCLITGANSGLGFALAVELAKRGAKVLMACRSGISDAGEKVKKYSTSEKVEMFKVDLSDLTSVDALVDELKSGMIKIDILICNAATVPSKARKTPQGFETMFVVNYLAKFVLLNRIRKENLLSSDNTPRIIIISSESHRSPKNLEFESFGNYEDFAMSKVVALYGYYKLALTTLAREFSRRTNDKKLNVSVHVICPGAINSNIAREAPGYTKPLIKFIFALFFQKPEKAAKPVSYLACSKEIEGRNDIYLHMYTEKLPDAKTMDTTNGKALWDRSNFLLKSVNYGRTF